MPRTEIELTGSFQTIATKKCVVTVTKAEAGGQIILNSTNSDTAALVESAETGSQYCQNETLTTYAKCRGEVTVIVDEVA